MAASESAQRSTIASPRRSAELTPGTRSSSATSTPGSVARIVRTPTIALISTTSRRPTRTPTGRC
jgi:hypothetical protein